MPPRYSSLEEIRAEIDRLDRGLVATLAERAQCVAAAAPFKSSASEVRAPDRVESMIAARRTWAQENGLSPDLVESLFRSITSHFISEELDAWTAGKGPRPTPVAADEEPA